MKDLNKYYQKYHVMLVPAVLLVASVIIVVFVVIPQISSISTTSATLSQKRDQVAQLTTSLTTIQNANDDQVNDNLAIVTTALPTTKDVLLIFNALTNAAADSGAHLS